LLNFRILINKVLELLEEPRRHVVYSFK